MSKSASEVREIAWDVAEKTGNNDEEKREIAKGVANTIWGIIHPNYELWQRTPRKS